MNKNISFKYLFLVISIYIFIFQNFLQTFIKEFQYFDEFFSLLFIPVFIINIVKNKQVKIIKSGFTIILMLLLIISIGIYSNIKYNYQSFKIVISDIIINCKPYFTFLVTTILFSKFNEENYKIRLSKHITFITNAMFILLLINYIFKIFPGSGIRFGVTSQKLFYSHPTYFAAVIVFILTLICFFKPSGIKRNKLILKSLIMLCSTLRIKAFTITIIFLILYWFIIINKNKITISKWIILALSSIFIAWSQIEYYFISLGKQSARSSLFIASINIAKDFFPFGTGFGTFASSVSKSSYSPVYYLYDLNNIWGLSESYNAFISDSFWPMILGQFGVIGLIFYFIIIHKLYRYTQSIYTQSYERYFICIFILIYLIISSISESSFVNPFAIPLMFILGLAGRYNEKIN